ncbi:MAG: sugar phosphate isomerase/epimerase [Anaerolineales bacterium]|nr:sugar phosphate isomerase/epimerase [Anaerolineales bacterium]
MRISCLPVSFFPNIKSGEMSLAGCARMVAGMGGDALDISSVHLASFDRNYLRQLRGEIEVSGIGLGHICGFTDFTHPDPAVRERELDDLVSLMKAALILGARYIRVTAGQAHRGTGRQEGINWAVEGLARAAGASEQYGIRLVYENHSKPTVWDHYDFSFPTDIFLEIVARTEGTLLGILFDTANTMAYGDDPLPVLEQVLHRVEVVHAADIAEIGVLKHVAVGAGVVPLDEIFGRLVRAGYDNWISIEEASCTGPVGVKQAIAFVRDAWNRATAVLQAGCGQ